MNKAEYVAMLKTRTNPDYDYDVDPSENEFEYWSPVRATNDLIKLANAALDITSESTTALRRKTAANAELREVRWKRERLERRLMAEEPLTTGEAKTLKTVAAAVMKRSWKDANIAASLDECEVAEERLEAEIQSLSGRIDELQTWLKSIERISDNLKTALSFYKDERRRA